MGLHACMHVCMHAYPELTQLNITSSFSALFSALFDEFTSLDGSRDRQRAHMHGVELLCMIVSRVGSRLSCVNFSVVDKWVHSLAGKLG